MTQDPFPERRATAGNRNGVRQADDVDEIDEKLRESTATLAHAQRCANAGVWDIDLVNKRVTWSEPYYDLYGLPRNLELSYENWIASIHPEDRERVDDEAAQSVAAPACTASSFEIYATGRSVG